MMVRWILMLGLGCGVALAQTQSLVGTVTNALDSTPIAGAKVTLQSSDTSHMVLTDRAGSFVFTGVPPGSYNLSADRAGYLAPDSQGQSMAMAAANVDAREKPNSIPLRLTPGATLTGTVTDENGFPPSNATISLIRREVSGGRAKWNLASQNSSNDLGEFRMVGLAAGSYLVCVNALASSYQRHRRLTYTTTCFPDVTDPLTAQWVNLTPGEVRTLAFHIAPVHGIRVSGTLENANKNASFSIKRMEPPGFPQLFTPSVEWDEKTSSFAIPAINPGAYLITANFYGTERQNTRAMRTILVGTEDIRDIRLTLRDGPYLSGTVRMGDTPIPPQNPNNIGFDGDRVLSVYVNASGSFKLGISEPGEYSVDVFPPPEWRLQSIRQGAADIRDRTIAIGPDGEPEPIEIVLARGGSTVEVSFPNDLAKTATSVKLTLLRRRSTGDGWAPEGQPAITNSAASLNLSNIAAGEYLLLAWPAAIEIEYLNPEVIKKYESFGQPVSVREGETSRVTVRLARVE